MQKDEILASKEEQIRTLQSRVHELEQLLLNEKKRAQHSADRSIKFEKALEEKELQCRLIEESKKKIKYLEERNTELIKQLQIKQEEIDIILGRLNETKDALSHQPIARAYLDTSATVSDQPTFTKMANNESFLDASINLSKHLKEKFNNSIGMNNLISQSHRSYKSLRPS